MALSQTLKGTLWTSIEGNSSVEVTCEELFKEKVLNLALTHLPHNISLKINGKKVYFTKSYTEKVDHPSHYGGADNPYEVIKVMEKWLTYEEFVGAMKFQQFKYLARAKKKDTEDENYAKATWYANYLTDYIKRRREEKS